MNEITGRRFFYWIGGFFGIIFIANAILIYLALTNWSGVETENAYEKGIAYQQQLDEAERIGSLGFKFGMEIRHDDSSGLLKIRSVAHNNADLPASGASVQLVFFRPTNEGFDTTVMLSETDVGVYEGETRLPKRGTWDLKMIAARDGEVIFRSRSRIDVR